MDLRLSDTSFTSTLQSEKHLSIIQAAENFPIVEPPKRMTKKILLVEDNLADVELVRLSVRELATPVELVHIGDGQEFLNFTETHDGTGFSVILLDLNMHRVSGLDILRQLKTNSIFRNIPIVVFTTSNSKSDIKQCYELGARAFVSKPFDILEFNETIKAIVDFWLSVNLLA